MQSCTLYCVIRCLNIAYSLKTTIASITLMQSCHFKCSFARLVAWISLRSSSFFLPSFKTENAQKLPWHEEVLDLLFANCLNRSTVLLMHWDLNAHVTPVSLCFEKPFSSRGKLCWHRCGGKKSYSLRLFDLTKQGVHQPPLQSPSSQQLRCRAEQTGPRPVLSSPEWRVGS